MAHGESKAYNPSEVERAIFESWIEEGHFLAHPIPPEADPAARDVAPDPAAPPDRRPPFCMVIPPPNVTGALHLGHALNNTLQDILVRRKRMEGFNSFWLVGTDHAGIATQATVEKYIRKEEGKSRHDLGREELVRRIWEWKEKYGGRIIEQLKLMGCSCDYSRERFTLDEGCAKAVRETFFKLFRDGLIYRGKRLVNWDTQLQTAVADDEVYHETVKGHLWYIRYPLLAANEVQIPELGGRRYEIPPEVQAAAISRATAPDAMFGRDYVLVATTRPETMLGDTAVAVHPNPEEALEKIESALYEKLRQATEKEKPPIVAQIGNVIDRYKTHLPILIRLQSMNNAYVMLPLLNLQIPVIRDEWADPSLGSGCVKITPAHDPNDYEVGKRHELFVSMISVMTPDGRVNENGGPYQGMKFADARKRIVEDLEKLSLVEKTEDRMIDLAHSDRSKTPIEPFLSDQWFVKMSDLPPERAAKIEGLRGASGLNQLAMDAVMSGKVRFFPERYASSYLDWLAEKRDWCISRQLWWGHRIPAWSVDYEFNAETVEEALESRGVLAILREQDAGIVGFIRVWRTREEPYYDESTDEVVDSKMYEKLAEGVLVKLSQDSRIVLEHKQAAQKDVAELGGIGEGRVELTMSVPRREHQAQLEGLGFQQDPDVLDTWFSSALWPHSTLGWPDQTEPRASASGDPSNTAAVPNERRPLPHGRGSVQPPLLATYYPTSVLSTAREIITLWVARMVMTGLYNIGEVPFRDVVIHPVIQDGEGRKMSKTLGNGVDPVDIIDEYGADALRFTLADLATETQDIRMPVQKKKLPDGRTINISPKFEKGRNFCNKLWQAATGYVLRVAADVRIERGPNGFHTSRSPNEMPLFDRWIRTRLSHTAAAVTEHLDNYRFAAMTETLRSFFWTEYCDWYIEESKSRMEAGSEAERNDAKVVLLQVLDVTLALLHPVVPFVTEAIWARIGDQIPRHYELVWPDNAKIPDRCPMLIAAPWPRRWEGAEDDACERDVGDKLQPLIQALRDIRMDVNKHRSQAGRPAIRTLPAASIRVGGDSRRVFDEYGAIIRRLGGVDDVTIDAAAAKPPGAMSRVIADAQLFVPVADLIDLAQVRQAQEAELAELRGNLARERSRLDNAGFVERADPAVVEAARQRAADLERKMELVEQHLREIA